MVLGRQETWYLWMGERDGLYERVDPCGVSARYKVSRMEDRGDLSEGTKTRRSKMSSSG